MGAKRQVNFQILFHLLKGKRSISFIGLLFTSLAIFVFLPMVLILYATLRAPYEKYDFGAITANGVEKNAEILAIDPVNNVSIDGEHPDVISYVFENNGRKISDKFETLDLEKVTNFSKGAKTKILFYQNQTMIKGLKPFAFPVYIFFLFPVLFLLFGLPLLLIGLIPALRIFNLYKTGIVKDAYVISMSPNSGIFSIFFKPNVFVNYYYLDEFKNKVFGESATTDYLILNEKKAEDTIKVFVSETDETKSCLVPKLEAMKYNWDV
jgi:hypothetical protein